MHPKERQTRRRLLQRSGAGLVALSGAAPLLASCSNNTAVSASTGSSGKLLGPSGLPLARPDQPVKYKLWRDPIASGMSPERGGTFNIFNYADYLYPKVAKEFGDKYDVKVQVTPITTMDQAIRKLADKTVDADVTNLIPDHLDQAVAGKLLQPINHAYIPNLAANVWKELQSPFYDVGSQFTIPYTTYGTGVGWRTDKLGVDVATLDNPWDVFWHSHAWKGRVAVLDDTGKPSCSASCADIITTSIRKTQP